MILDLAQNSPLNPFTTGNPFLRTKLLRFSIGRGSGALKGLEVKIPTTIIVEGNKIYQVCIFVF